MVEFENEVQKALQEYRGTYKLSSIVNGRPSWTHVKKYYLNGVQDWHEAGHGIWYVCLLVCLHGHLGYYQKLS